MNIMRKLLVGHSRTSQGEDAPQSAQHTALGLMHLHKLFAELAHSPHAINQQEQEQRLYNMLPLFCKVFGNCPASDMMEKFGDILAFCQLVSRLMVSEIRRRASNQSTEAASCAIAKFLEIESTEERSNGWMLLTTLNLLAAGGAPLIEVMTSSSLPSTLVKCLYLFFDLPELENADELEPESEFSPKERRILLQKVFMQVLVRLCSYAAPAEELARKDDLTLLFSAITSWCPPHNTAWRKSAAEVLMTVSRHGLTNNVVTYIHNKGCVGVCIENMQRVQELSPLEIVEMFVTVFCFLKDSSEVSQVLLDDFRSVQGYVFLSEFILRLEVDSSQEAIEALRNLVLLVASLTTCGYVELKPSHASTGSLFHIPGFQLPVPSGRGASVRNIQAFQVLQSIFLKAQTCQLCSMLLDAISTVYHSDKANYFILESLHTLSQFAEKIHLKTPEIQSKFFSLLEFIVFELKFVPCKELISLSILLKTQSSVACCITCMQTLLNILRSNSVFKDVYREVGLLEVMVTCLHRYATLLKEAYPEGEGEYPSRITIPEEQQFLGSLVMEALTVLLSGNSSNANVFRECGGARCAHNLVPYHLSRQAALGIVQQLVLSNGGDDDMGTLLGMMHTAPTLLLDLKTHILKSLLHVLRESHRTRTVFRRVGGFVYVMSVLVSMEGCLADPPKPPWDTVEKKKVLTMLRTVFSTLTVAMRFEPANARFFASEICPTSLTDTVRLLGCFTNETLVKPLEFSFTPQQESTFHALFTSPKDSKDESVQHNIPRTLESVCIVMRLLYDMTLDAFDKPAASLVPQSPSLRSMCLERSGSVGSSCGSPVSNKRAAVSSLNLTPPAADPIIVHPGVVVAMLHLLPSIQLDANHTLSMTLQLYLAEVLRSLVRAERNQQVMCDAGLPGELLSRCQASLENEMHPLHHAFQYMLERLAAQSLEPRDLRAFLRLGSPLCCTPFDDTGQDPAGCSAGSKGDGRPANQRDGGPVPLTRVKTLVSMTTPRDFRLHGAAITPPFVEFDMSSEGFSCLYVPSIAPQSASGPGVVGVGMVGMGGDSSVVGGIGTGDRVFPSQPGVSFSTWVCVDKFSDPQMDPHSVRLLTLIRNVHNREDHLICFSLTLSSRDKALLISTQEIPLPQTGGVDWEPEVNEESCVRIWTPELIQEGQWHHVVVVLNRAVLKNSSVSLYVDGQHVATHKLHYISQNPGGGAANLIVTSSVYGFVGTPPHFRRQSRLVWKQGPCHLVEDVLSANTVTSMFQLGPSYVGSLQAPIINGPEPLGPFVPEEKVVFGINASAVSVMTLAKMRRVYSKVDCKSIAKMLGLSSHENATPIHVLHNSAGHLSGPARSLGGVLIGYLGARTFVPRPVSLTVQDVGGTAALLGLVAMAKDVEGLYAAVKALVCVVRSHRAAQQEMDRTRGYQTLAMLLKKKRPLLNSHILHLTFSLVGTIDSGRETTTIPNVTSFKDLLCDLDVWKEAPGDLQKSLYEHFFELVTESGDQKTNLRILRELGMVAKLLQILKELDLSSGTLNVLRNLLAVLLHNTPRSSDIRCFGQFVAATLPASAVNERQRELDKNAENDDTSMQLSGSGSSSSLQAIQLRNSCLRLLYALFFTGNKTVNYPFCEEVMRILGFDWLLLFLQGHLHPSSTVWALKILVLLVSHPPLLQRFREASSNGGWLTETEPVLQNRMNMLLGFNMGTTNRSREIRLDACQVPGFQHLQWLATHHVTVTEVYLLLLMMLLCQPIKEIPYNPQLSLDTIWSFLFGTPTGHSSGRIITKGDLCAEAAVVLLAMVRTLLNLPPNNSNSSNKEETSSCVHEYPITVIQFLMFLYHNRQDFMHICMTSDLLCALAATLFPLNVTSWSEPGSEATSPLEDCQPFPGIESSSPVTKSNADSCTPGGGDGTALTCHPARKFIMDFLRVIVVDSLSLPAASKQSLVIDLLLEASPTHASRAQQCEFQTELLTSLMEHLLAADVLLGEQAALPIAAGGSYSNIAPNVFYFTCCLVDRLWQGTFIRDSHEVLDFILKLLTQAKRKGLQVSLESIHHSLNRTILYLLSRPMESVSDRMSTLECLQKIITHRNIILGPTNTEAEFFGCLCHCLLQLMDDAQVSLETNRRTTWHVSNLSDLSGSPLTSAQEGSLLVAAIARNVWEELYNIRKQTLEEVCKVPIGSSGTSNLGLSQAPDLHSLRDLLREPTGKLWANYLDTERRCGYKESWQLHTQLQNRLQRVTGGLTRLASRRSRKEQSTRMMSCNLSMQDVESWTLTHISIVRDLVELQSKQLQQSQYHLQQYVFEEWLQTEAELTRERGLWGPLKGSRLDKWMLDMTEGPCRMRKKMVKNENFYMHYPYRPEVEGGDNKALKYKVATSFDSKEYYKRWRPENMVERDNLSLDSASLSQEDMAPQQEQESSEEREIGFQGLRTASLLPRPPTNRSLTEQDEDQESMDVGLDVGLEQEGGQGEQHHNLENQTVLRLLEEGEKISHMFRCARIQGLDTCEGLLLFGKEHFYVIDGFTLLKSREIRDIDSLPANMHDPIIPNSSCRVKRQKRTCSKFAYEDIREVHKRRYLLQPIALEVFSTDGRNYLLAFPRKVRNKVYSRFLAVATAITDNAQESLAGQKRGANVESSAGLLSSLIGETSVTQRWVRGEISNFQYLMHLNTLAGRSYNDLMQYPVFPWVLADYESEELDLTDPRTFRDFSKPMGAQTPDRLIQFKKRYKEWDDPHGETPPYHYGTFYSSAMIVASYLVRMEPFTQHFLRLQGGHFDLADRMFHSVGDAWLSAAKHNMADVKELIPEFFYLPEFLVNSNQFDLGCKQNGIQLNDVVLPSWAKGDPREFIRVHRQALECDYVSTHLNEWIDLIFGCKQQGSAAVEAVNVFHHLFYEGNVDIYSIEDPLKKNAAIGFINNFGQIPKQLFKKPHPCKKLTNRVVVDPGPIMPGLSCSHDKLFFHNLDNLRPSMHPVKELKGPVGQIIQHEKALLAVEQNKVLVPPTYARYIAWGFADHSLRMGPYESERATFVWEELPGGEVLCCTCPNSRSVVTAGTSSVVTVWHLDKKRLILKQNLHGHTEPVTCLAASSAYGLIVSGSRDRSCIVWDLNRLVFVHQLGDHPAPVAAVAINDLTGDVATCAGTYLFLWTINGKELASVNTATGRSDRTQQILCVCFSQLNEWDNQNVVMTGSSDGVVRMWSTDYVQVPVDRSSGKSSTSQEIEDTEALSGDMFDDDGQIAPNSEEETKESKAEQIVRRMSLADTENMKNPQEDAILQHRAIGACLAKSGSDSSLSEHDREWDTSPPPGKGQEESATNGADAESLSDKDVAEDLAGEEADAKTDGDPDTRQRRERFKKRSARFHHHKSMPDSLASQCSSSDNEGAGRTMTEKETAPRHGISFEDEVDASIAKTAEAAKSLPHIQRCSTVGTPDMSAREDKHAGSSSGDDGKVGLRMSKSDTSLADSYVMVNENDAADSDADVIRKYAKRKKKLLREGFRWQCQLVFRSKLTMHTAFDRKDNTEPAAVTSLAVSKDHKIVYVGDARGRVFNWSVTDRPGRAMADHWVKDEGGDSCVACGVRFSFAERRHHCRNCGQLFCSRCSRFECEINRLRILKPVRVCQACYNILKAQQASDILASS